MPKSKPFNPFYALLVIVGVAFCLTASAYGVMTLRASKPTVESAAVDRVHPLWRVLDTHGTSLLAGELVLLGAFTVGAIGTDDFWIRRAQAAARKAAAGEPQQEDRS